ncbi:MAG: hypothetical protein ACQESR_11795 [Planctomycetota bacterium]
MESGPTQAVLPLVGLAADEVIRDRYRPVNGLEAGVACRPETSLATRCRPRLSI